MSPMARHLRQIHQIGNDTQEWLVPASRCTALAHFGIHMCGISEARYGFSFQRAEHRETQVLATVSGSGTVLVHGRWQTCSANQAYLTPPITLHAYRCPRAEQWQVVWVIYGADHAPTNIAEPHISPVDADGLHQAVRGLHHEMVGKHDQQALHAWASLVDLLARRCADGHHNDRLASVWQQVSANPAGPWTLAHLAHAAQLGPEQVRRLCRKTYGTSPLAHVTTLRMRHAMLLLAAGRNSVAEIGERVGYANPFAFSTAFKRFYGYPPSQALPP